MNFFYIYDLSIETKYIKLNTKTQNIFYCFRTFLYTLTGGTRKEKEKKSLLFKVVYKSQMLLKKWVLVFSFMYFVSVDPMDRS